MKYEIRSLKGYRSGMQYVWGEGSLSGNNIYSCKALRGTEEKSFEAENTRLFIRFTRDLNDNMWEVLGAKKILCSPSSSTMHME